MICGGNKLIVLVSFKICFVLKFMMVLYVLKLIVLSYNEVMCEMRIEIYGMVCDVLDG